MKTFEPLHTLRTHTVTLDLPPGRALAFFEPEGERAWAPGWAPEYLHPRDGTTVAGMVFTTGHGGEHTIWTMTRHDPRAGVVEYQRVTPGSRTGRVTVSCEPADENRTRVTATYEMTALSEDGNARLAEMDEVRYRAYIDSWAEAIAAVATAARR